MSNKKDENKFCPYATITVNKEQYWHIMNVLETAGRIACGQLQDLYMLFPWDIRKLQKIEPLADELKRIAFPELHGAEYYPYDGGHTRPDWDKRQKQGYQIWREMRHCESVRNNWDDVYRSPTLAVDGVFKPRIEFVNGKDINIPTKAIRRRKQA